MKFIRAFILAFIVAITVAGHLRAQFVLPVIVKDYNNCTEGLQDANGKWIAQPVYTLIQPFIGYCAIATRDNKFGLIDIYGKEVIPARWKNLALSNYCYNNHGCRTLYVATGGRDSTFLLDTSGKVIVSAPYRFGPIFQDSVAMAKDAEGRIHFVRLDGRIIDCPAYIKEYPERVKNNTGHFDFTIDSLVPVEKRTFKVSRRFHGVINSMGVIIVPPGYTSLEYSEGYHAMYVVHNPPYTGYYSRNGREIWECKYANVVSATDGYSWNLSIAPVMATLDSMWGVMNWNGDTLLPFEYEEKPQMVIMGSDTGKPDTSFIVKEENHYGVYNRHKGWIIPLLYDKLDAYRSLYSYYNKVGYFVTTRNGKYGCIDSYGNEMLPSVYDTVFFYNRSMLFWSPGNALMMEQTTDEGYWGLSQERYDQWFPPGKKIEYTGPIYVDDDYPRTSNGHDTLIEENYVWEDYYYSVYPDGPPKRNKRKGNPNPYPWLVAQRPVLQLVATKLDTVPGNLPGCTTYMRYRPGATPEYDQTEIVCVVWTDSNNVVRTAGRESQLSPYLWTFGTTGVMIYSGRVVVKPGTYTPISSSNDLIFAKDDTGNIVVLDTLGNIVCRTAGAGMEKYSGDTVWLMNTNSRDTTNGYNPVTVSSYTYSLFDLRKRTYVTDTTLKIISPFAPDNQPVLLRTRSGDGYISTSTLKIYVAPLYRKVQPLDDTYQFYTVLTCTGKIGIVDSNNILVADTLYENITQLKSAASAPVNHEYIPLAGEDSRFLLFTPDGPANIFSTLSGSHPSDSIPYGEVMQSILVQSSRTDGSMPFINQELAHAYLGCTECKQYLKVNGTDSLREWQNAVLFSVMFLNVRQFTLFADRALYNQCACSRAPQSIWAEPDYSSYNWFAMRPTIVKRTSDSLMTFVILQKEMYTENHWNNNNYAFRNVLLFSDGPHVMTLDSLFTGNAWQNIITDSVLAYLNVHKGIDADCSRPGAIPKTLNENFLIGENGLYLYPEWTRMTGGGDLKERPVVFIPWTVLDPCLRNDVRTKIHPEKK